MARRRQDGSRRRRVPINFDKISHEAKMAALSIGMECIGVLAEKIAEEANANAPVINPTPPPLAGQALRRGPDKTSGKQTSGPIKGNVFAQESAKVPFSYLVCAPAWYAHYSEYGTDPHDISAKKSKILAFRAKDGSEVFAKTVSHPGVKPKPFLRPAADKAEQFLDEILNSGRW